MNAIAGNGVGLAKRVGGLSVLKGLILYGAVAAFAALYVYFVVEIFQASAGAPPAFSTAIVSAAAALAGVLGSAFALAVGVPTTDNATNQALCAAIGDARDKSFGRKLLVILRRALSLEPAATDQASWPMTAGIWIYAAVATCVAITYVVNQNETPDSVKALAVAFGGYVIAFVTAAYRNQ